MYPRQNNTNTTPGPEAESLDSATPAVSTSYTGSPDSTLQDSVSEQALASQVVEMQPPKMSLKSLLVRYRIVLLGILLLVIGSLVFATKNGGLPTTAHAGDFDPIKADLTGIASDLSATPAQSLFINGKLQIASSIVISPSVQPSSGVAGQLYFDQATNQLNYYNGQQYLPVGGNTTFIQNTTNILGGNSVTNITNATAGVTTTGGTTNSLVKFTGAQSIADSIITDNATYITVGGGINISADTAIVEKTLYSPSTVPATFDTVDGTPSLEVGVKFQVDVPGVVKAVRFYKSPTQTGTFVASLWTGGGTLLGQGAVTVSASGWQQFTFPSPIAVSTDTTYVASYHNNPAVPGSPLGYPYEGGGFGASSIDNPPLHGLASGIDGGNGVFKASASPSFPNQSYNSTSYFVDVLFAGSVYTDDSKIKINNGQISSSDLSNDNNLAKRASSQVFSGHNIFRNGSDSADAFSIQRADTTALFTVDTISSRIYIGPGSGSNLAVLLILSMQTTTDDPPGTDGAIYYNNVLEMFRCFQDSAWVECGNTTVSHGFSLYEEFMGGQVTSFGTNDTIGSLGWDAQAIGANGNITFNPSTPTPVAERPGVLALQTPAVANQGTTLSLSNANGASMLINKGNVVRASAAVGSTTNTVLRVGLHDETSTTTAPVSGVWWEANTDTNANWRYCYGNGTTATCANSTVAITANAWARLEIRVTAIGASTSSVEFYINNNLAGALNTITIDSTNRVSPAYTCYTTTGAAKDCYWDYYQLRGISGTAR